MMLCDELMKYGMNDPTIGDDYEMYRVADVDAAIAELKSENERLNRELEHVKNGDCINTCDVVEKHVKEEIKAKRDLWLARANYCHNFRVDWYISRHPHSKMRQSVMENTLIMAEMNCRAKAEEYK